MSNKSPPRHFVYGITGIAQLKSMNATADAKYIHPVVITMPDDPTSSTNMLKRLIKMYEDNHVLHPGVFLDNYEADLQLFYDEYRQKITALTTPKEVERNGAIASLEWVGTRTIRVNFRDPNHAMIFKLTHG